jgi:hypothetical protein
LWVLEKCESIIRLLDERLKAHFISRSKIPSGVKSHDYHVLLTQMITVGIQNILPVNVQEAIINFCFFFIAIGQKVLCEEALESLEKGTMKLYGS